MYEEIKFRNITYLISLTMIVDVVFGISDSTIYGDFIFDIITLTGMTTLFFWLRKLIILIGLFFYFLIFNIGLLFSPVIPYGMTLNQQVAEILMYLEFIAFFLIITALIDSSTGDKLFKSKPDIKLMTVVLSLISGTLTIQLIGRLI